MCSGTGSHPLKVHTEAPSAVRGRRAPIEGSGTPGTSYCGYKPQPTGDTDPQWAFLYYFVPHMDPTWTLGPLKTRFAHSPKPQ